MRARPWQSRGLIPLGGSRRNESSLSLSLSLSLSRAMQREISPRLNHGYRRRGLRTLLRSCKKRHYDRDLDGARAESGNAAARIVFAPKEIERGKSIGAVVYKCYSRARKREGATTRTSKSSQTAPRGMYRLFPEHGATRACVRFKSAFDRHSPLALYARTCRRR